ncbi:MAG: glycosyltransferase [Chlamydiota bacterium]
MEREPRVIVIVLAWNGRDDVLECLGSVAKTGYGNFGTVLVDNASTDGTAGEVRARFPTVTIVRSAENPGHAGMRCPGGRPSVGREAGMGMKS